MLLGDTFKFFMVLNIALVGLFLERSQVVKLWFPHRKLLFGFGYTFCEIFLYGLINSTEAAATRCHSKPTGGGKH